MSAFEYKYPNNGSNGLKYITVIENQKCSSPEYEIWIFAPKVKTHLTTSVAMGESLWVTRLQWGMLESGCSTIAVCAEKTRLQRRLEAVGWGRAQRSLLLQSLAGDQHLPPRCQGLLVPARGRGVRRSPLRMPSYSLLTTTASQS